MYTAYQLLEKFLILFKIKKNKPIINNASVYTGINFALLDNNPTEIEIGCFLPDINNKSSDEIALIAEKYTNFLVSITSGEMNGTIFKLLEKTINSNSDPDKILLINNISSFWPIIYKEKQQKKQKKYSQYQPVVRPIEAFRV
jgi:hypothetical protein